jgi:hypothetical protein
MAWLLLDLSKASKSMEPLRGNSKTTIYFLIFCLFLTIPLIKNSLYGKEDADQCVNCHTDVGKMKKMITKFPEPPAEEGEA